MAERRGAGDEIHLEVPTTPDLLRLVRVVASGLASRLGFPIDAVEDVRLAVDELCWTVASKAGVTATLAVRFIILDAAFTVEGRLQPGPDEELAAASAAASVAASVADGWHGELSALSVRILDTLVEDYGLLEPADGQGPGFRMRTKQV